MASAEEEAAVEDLQVAQRLEMPTQGRQLVAPEAATEEARLKLLSLADRLSHTGRKETKDCLHDLCHRHAE